MHTLHVRNVHSALPVGLRHLSSYGRRRSSRNGDVLVNEGPLTTVYEQPCERVIFWPERDANPFFHLMESLWMLAGRNDVQWLTKFVKRMRSFSDDGKTLHGAYGYRWRNSFGVDQLEAIISRLAANPDDRRCVLQMWSADRDLDVQSKDVPCNVEATFSVNADGALDMHVFNRSNDCVWGAYGANAVHFSVLQEYMAAGIQYLSNRPTPVGRYWQISTNFHLYDFNSDKVKPLAKHHWHVGLPERGNQYAPYASGDVAPFPLVEDYSVWWEDLEIFMSEGPIVGLREPFFRRVVTPMWRAHEAYRQLDNDERFEHALEILESCQASDWRRACREWIIRRWEDHHRAKDDGVAYE